MARATAHLDAIPSDWKPPVPLHDKVAGLERRVGEAVTLRENLRAARNATVT